MNNLAAFFMPASLLTWRNTLVCTCFCNRAVIALPLGLLCSEATQAERVKQGIVDEHNPFWRVLVGPNLQ
jgi:hypothetical protein